MIADEPLYPTAKIRLVGSSSEYPRRSCFTAKTVLQDVPAVSPLPKVELPPCAVSIKYLVAFVLAGIGVSVEVVCAVRNELLDFFRDHLAVLSVVLNRPQVRPLGTVVD